MKTVFASPGSKILAASSRLGRDWRPAARMALEMYTQDRVLFVTILLSSACGLAALALGLRMVGIASATLLPWIPVLVRKTREDWLRYGALALFQVTVVLQMAHLAEHVSQMVELHLLDWPAALARGIAGELDIEPVHFWWNTIILAAAVLLLLRYRENRWLWASFLFSVWHEIEHVYIYFTWFLPKGISGHPGVLGAGGLLDEAAVSIPPLTDLGRADLHFWYNLFEIGLFVIAFAVQVHAYQNAHQDTRATAVGQKRGLPKRKWAMVGLGLAQVGLVIGAALVRYSPWNQSVPANFPTIQAAVDAAPDWAIVRIAPGVYDEQVQIRKPLTILSTGGAGATQLVGPLDRPVIWVNRTHDVSVRGLTVEGGLYGILVEESQAIQIQNNRVHGAQMAGIRLSRAAAEITGNWVEGTLPPYGMGIELANTVSRPMSLIRKNTVVNNPHEGIILHNSHALVEKNVVTGNGLRGIAITEMSMATVQENTMAGNTDAGIFVVDMSMADIHSNRVSDMREGPSGAADGIRAYLNAEVMLGTNALEVDPAHAVVARQGATIETTH